MVKLYGPTDELREEGIKELATLKKMKDGEEKISESRYALAALLEERHNGLLWNRFKPARFCQIHFMPKADGNVDIPCVRCRADYEAQCFTRPMFFKFIQNKDGKNIWKAYYDRQDMDQ